jgi:membrane protease YdiL (CAAX protease family)
VRLAAIGSIVFWVALVLGVLLLARWRPGARRFRQALLAQWQPAVAIAVIFLVGMALGGRSPINPYALAVFCQALVGLALASGIEGFEPLPVAQAVSSRRRPWRRVALTLAIAALAVVPAQVAGSAGLSVGRRIFGEPDRVREAMDSLPPGPLHLFFLLLAGAGIAEETTYRLVALSLAWRLTGRPGVAIVLSAVLFGAYHLTPLSGMYQTFWRFPASQFLGSSLVGLIWGWLYVKRGYETVVLGHTLSDWDPFALMTALQRLGSAG